MADSLRAMLRARVEKLRGELQPEAGFDRRAYGYEDDGGDDATFEDVAREDESPWARSDGDPRARPAPDPSPAPSGEGGSRRPARPRADARPVHRSQRPRENAARLGSAAGKAPGLAETLLPHRLRKRPHPAGVRASRPAAAFRAPPRAHALKRVRSAGRSRRACARGSRGRNRCASSFSCGR